MKKVLIIAALLFSATTQAEEVTAETCALVSQIAHKVMEARQSNVSMMNALDVMEGNALGVMLVKEAYSTPKYTTDSYKQNAINEFSNKYTAMCFKLVK